MLPTLLAVFALALPQGSRQRNTPARYLPDDRTVLVLEIPQPKLVAEHSGQLFQLQLLDLPSFRAGFRQAAKQGAPFGKLMTRLPELGKLLSAFDRGLVAANVIPGEDKRPAGTCLAGMASTSSALRGQREVLLSFFRENPKAKPEPTPNNYWAQRPPTKITEQPLADTPVRAYWLQLDREQQETWYWASTLAFAYKSRQAVFHSAYSSTSAGKEKAMMLLADLLGLGPRGPKYVPLASERPLSPGEQLLASFRLRFARLRERSSDRTRKEMVAAGFASFDGMRSDLVATPSGLREEIEFHDKKPEGSLFRVFKSTGFGVRQAAELLPAETIACAKLGFDPKAAQDWLHGIAKMNRVSVEEMDSILATVRGLAGFTGEPGKVVLDGLNELVVAIVPPAAGSPLFEPVLVVPLAQRKLAPGVAVQTVLSQVIKTLKQLSATDVPEARRVRTYGKGAETVQYIRLKDYFPELSSDFKGIAMKLLGGGFISATEIDGHLFVGCNPKSLRKIRRAVAEGHVLANVRRFEQAFGEPGSRPLEGYFDFARLGRKSGAGVLVTAMMPMMFYASADPRAYAQMILFRMFTTGAALGQAARLLAPETLVATETAYGYRVIHTGSTLLSPTAWAGFGFAASFLSSMSNLAR